MDPGPKDPTTGEDLALLHLVFTYGCIVVGQSAHFVNTVDALHTRIMLFHLHSANTRQVHGSVIQWSMVKCESSTD